MKLLQHIKNAPKYCPICKNKLDCVITLSGILNLNDFTLIFPTYPLIFQPLISFGLDQDQIVIEKDDILNIKIPHLQKINCSINCPKQEYKLCLFNYLTDDLKKYSINLNGAFYKPYEFIDTNEYKISNSYTLNKTDIFKKVRSPIYSIPFEHKLLSFPLKQSLTGNYIKNSDHLKENIDKLLILK